MESTIGLIVELIAILVAIGLGLASILRSEALQKKESKQRILNELISWATDLINCSSDFDIPVFFPGIKAETLLLPIRSAHTSNIEL